MKLELVRNELDAVNGQLPLTSWNTRKNSKLRYENGNMFTLCLQKIIMLCNCKYCFKIRIIYIIIIVYIACVKGSVHVNGSSIRNTFTDCKHEMFAF